VLIGALSGYFVVPMNALLQHRGHVLMSAGHSIAVQNFNENLSVLTMLVLYALMVKLDLNVEHRHRAVRPVRIRHHVDGDAPPCANQREHDSLALIGEHKH
jgi:LPLT family lysophospholipid transporter-like MFS transporter